MDPTPPTIACKVYLVQRGQVQIFKAGPTEDLPIAVLSAGDVTGEMALFEQGRRGASARALTPCTLFSIEGPGFLTMLF